MNQLQKQVFGESTNTRINSRGRSESVIDMQALPEKAFKQPSNEYYPVKTNQSPIKTGDQSGLGGFSMSQSMFEKNYLLGIQDPETTVFRDAMHRQSFPEPTVMSRQQDEVLYSKMMATATFSGQAE